MSDQTGKRATSRTGSSWVRALAEQLFLGVLGIFAVTYGIGAAAGGSEIGGAVGLTAGALALWALLRG